MGKHLRLYGSKDIHYKCIKWVVGNGCSIDLWKDWWCGKGPLENIMPITHLNPIKVNTIISDNGGWNLFLPNVCFSREVHDKILSTHLPFSSSKLDIMCWAQSRSGKFYVGSCYNLNLKEKGIVNENDTN